MHTVPTAALLIDGGYLSNIVKHRLGSDQRRFRLDYTVFRAYCQRLIGATHCLSYFVDGAAPSSQGFHNYLSAKGFIVRLGSLGYETCRGCGYTSRKQKQVDGHLDAIMCELMLDQPQVRHFALVAGDKDFVPMVEVACRHRITITLIHAENVASELLAAVSCVKPLHLEVLKAMEAA